jgi:hypothetical protein
MALPFRALGQRITSDRLVRRAHGRQIR